MLLTFLCSRALAGTVVWFTEPPRPLEAPADDHVSAQELVGERGLDAGDVAALEALTAEVEAVSGLLDAFGGEEAIMERLQVALDAVTFLRGPEDRAIVREALLLQGLAVERWWGADLATEDAADPWRTVVAGAWHVRPWVDAVALDPDRRDPPAGLENEPAWAALDLLRQAQLTAPPSYVRAEGFEPDCVLWLDGRPAAAQRLEVAPGVHRAHVTCGGVVVARGADRLWEGKSLILRRPFLHADIPVVAAVLTSAEANVALPPPAIPALASLGDDVRVAVERPDGTVRVFAVASGLAWVPAVLPEVAPEVDALPEGRLPGPKQAWVELKATAGLGWGYDRDYYTLLADRGIPDARSTVHVPWGVAGLGVAFTPSVFAVGVGADVMAAGTVNGFLVHPDGREQKLRGHVYGEVGLRWLRATAGLLYPWHTAVGGRAVLNVNRWVVVEAGGLYGLSRTEARGPTPPVPGTPAACAWLGAGGHLGLWEKERR